VNDDFVYSLSELDERLLKIKDGEDVALNILKSLLTLSREIQECKATLNGNMRT
jgi:hypothetical protein